MTQDSKRTLYGPATLGDFELQNRVWMAPLTRNRAVDGDVPNPLAVEYYRQRASAGLIITEASQVSPQGVGYPNTPGIHREDQIGPWKEITDAVHAEGGRIFLQLWHVGRISHPSFHGGELPVAPSAIAPEGDAFTATGPQPFVTPRALDASELPGVVASYRRAAELADRAGFDGVEVHGANGYLLDQFLRSASNQRDDEYGGSLRRRAKLMLEVVDAVTEVLGASRVGVRLSPVAEYHSMSDADPDETFTHVANELRRRGIAYLHLVEMPDFSGTPTDFDFGRIKAAFDGPIVGNGNYDRARAEAALAAGEVDFVAFGRSFIANPDLPRRLELDAALNEPDAATFYGGDEKGFTDYPTLEQVEAAE